MKTHCLLCALLIAGCSSNMPTVSSNTKDTAATSGVSKPPIVTRAQWGSQPDAIPDSRKQTPEWVTIHHAGELWTNRIDGATFVKNMQDWGKKRPQIEQPPRNTYWPDVPYHFLIAPDGRIFEGREIQYEPDSNTNYSLKGNIGVELMGDFERQRPSQKQVESCARLTAWLCHQYKIDLDHVRTHRDAAPGQTTCPGKDFYRYIEDGEFKTWVKQIMAGKDPHIVLGPPLKDGPTTSITDFKPPATRPAK